MYRFSEDFLKTLKNDVEVALKNGAEPIAAFDADGTLWSTDLGESFFKYQYHNGYLENLPENPWEYYLELHAKNPEASYLWLAQINEGINIDQVRQWARETVKTHPDMGVFSGQKELIQFLHKLHVKVYVVTASIKWAVEPGAELFGVPQENVIGVQTKIIDGKVSTEQEGPITYKAGKVDGLLLATAGKSPFLVAGNSNGDLPMLEKSTHLKLVLNSATPDNYLYKTERQMIDLARERGWHNYTF